MKQDIITAWKSAYEHLSLVTEKGYMGIIWYLADSMMLFGIFVFLRGIIMTTHETTYPAYLLIGIIVFNFFRRATVQSGDSFHKKKKYPNKIVEKESVLILEQLFHVLMLHFFEIILLVVVMIHFSIPIWHLLLYIPYLFIFLLFLYGISYSISVVGYFQNNIRQAWILFLRMLWIGTPIFYSLSEGHFLSKYNPMTYVIEASRDVLMEGNIFSKNFIFFVLFSLISVTFGLLLSRGVKLSYDAK